MVSTGLSEVIGSWNTTASERPRSLRRRSRREPHQILAVEHHAAGQFRFLRQQLQDRARQHGLAAAGFADDAERPAGADGQIDMVHRAQIAARRRQVDRDVLDGKQAGPVTARPAADRSGPAACRRPD